MMNLEGDHVRSLTLVRAVETGPNLQIAMSPVSPGIPVYAGNL